MQAIQIYGLGKALAFVALIAVPGLWLVGVEVKERIAKLLRR